MLNLLPVSAPAGPPPEGTEAAARLMSIRQALRAADMMAGKNSADCAAPVEVTELWGDLTPAHRRCFAARSSRAANAAVGGLETIMAAPVNPAAAERLAEELRAALPHIEQLLAHR